MNFALRLGTLALMVCAVGAIRAAEEPKVPDWVPVFPDVKPQLIENKKDDKGTSVIWYFATVKSPADVKAFYKKGFEASGFKEQKEQSIDDKDDGVKQENLKGDDGKRSWFISARLEKDAKETQVSLVYVLK
ncbi:MAG: hypothetical protein WCT04_15680 [Planctomycetota bacterium]